MESEQSERASEASITEQANERTDERVAQYFSLHFRLFWLTVDVENKGGKVEEPH